MQRKKLIAGNWKMNNTVSEAVVLAQEISYDIYKDWFDKVDIVVCPPFVDLKSVSGVFEFDHCKVGIGAQNVYWEEKGAFTGEISVKMIHECGCDWCIVGHSERRGLFLETSEDINKKTKALLAADITPIICVGESLAVRDEGSYLEFVCDQIQAAFAGIDEINAKKCVVAYEPIWAIGTGRTATPEQAEEVCGAIRRHIAELFDDATSEAIRILYGGSMNEGNAGLLLSQENIDGGLIGGASLKADSFIEIIKQAL